jgi:hypothetical protein
LDTRAAQIDLADVPCEPHEIGASGALLEPDLY